MYHFVTKARLGLFSAAIVLGSPMHRYFSLSLPIAIFARNVALVSLLTLLPLLAIYVALQPGFAAMLSSGGPALSRFLRQVATNGFPVVFIVNFLGFVLYARHISLMPRTTGGLGLIFTDMVMRVAVFILLHAVIYVASADWFGSFGGSKGTALRVVAPTLARSALFDNISGVYLYAVLLGALPIYAAALSLRQTSAPKARAWLAAAICCGLLALALTLVARGMVQMQSG